MVEYLEAFFGDNLVTLRNGKIFRNHFLDKFGKAYFGFPTEFFPGLGGVTQQGFHFSRAEVTGINGMLDEIAEFNRAILQVENGNTPANDLRDQRDLLIKQLSEKLDVRDSGC